MADSGKIDFKNVTIVKIAIFALLGIIVLYIWFAQVYTVKRKIIDEKTAQLTSLKADYEKVKSSLARVEELKWDLQQLFAKYKLIEELVPEKRDIADFITKSYFAAKQADVEIIRLEPKESIPMTYYVQDKYSLNIESTYEGIGKFIALIANLPFTALVDDVNISVKSGDARSLSMTVKTHHMEPSTRITSIQDLRKTPTGGKGPSPKVTKGGPPSIPKGPPGKPSG